MKTKLVIFILLALASSIAYSAVNDNTGPLGKTGTGSFNASIITPISGGIMGLEEDMDMGEFVKSVAPYTPDASVSSITFGIDGQPGNTFNYRITQDLLGDQLGIAHIVLKWTAGPITGLENTLTVNAGPTTFSGVLDPTRGSYVIQAEVLEVYADNPGTTTFFQLVEWQYNGF